MPSLIGVCIALGIAGFAHLTRFNRDYTFYTTIHIVIAFYYELFAVMGGMTDPLVRESGGVTPFILITWLAFRHSA
jgi:hypothetical protein